MELQLHVLMSSQTLVCVQFGHLFAKGSTREAAIRSMVVALKEVKIRGEIRTIVDYVIEMIQHPDFINNNIHTAWLDSRIAAHVSSPVNSQQDSHEAVVHGHVCYQCAGTPAKLYTHLCA